MGYLYRCHGRIRCTPQPLGYTLATFPINATRDIALTGLTPALPMGLRHLRIVFRHTLIVLGGS